jgi:enoyl-CoA hydratase
MVEGSLIQLTITDDRAEIVIDRPERLNALSVETFASIDGALNQISMSDARTVLLRGAGDRAFCAGADIEELAGTRGETRDWLLAGQSVLRRIESYPRPVVAVVAGFALGGGFELAMACHLLVATTKARFGLPEPRLGLIPGLGGVQRLTGMVGRHRANRFLLTGDSFTAAQADSLGLLSFPPVDPESLEAVIDELCGTISELAPTALAAVLGSQMAAESLSFQEALLHDVELAVEAIHSEAGQEGRSAFAAKRPPSFKPPGGTDE